MAADCRLARWTTRGGAIFFRKPKEHHEQRRRALGQLLDRGGLRSLRIIEQPGRVVFQGVPGGILRRGHQTHWLTVEQLRAAAFALQRGEPPTLPQVSPDA